MAAYIITRVSGDGALEAVLQRPLVPRCGGRPPCPLLSVESRKCCFLWLR